MISDVDDESTPPFVAASPLPRLSPAALRARQERVAAEYEAQQRAEVEDGIAEFLVEMQARADHEVARWSALPCRGELEYVTECSEATAASCVERSHVMCPRNQLVRIAEERAEERRRKRQALLRAGVSERTIEAVFDRKPLETEALRGLREALSMQPPRCLVILQGGVGSGKTCAAAWWAIQHGALWITAPRLARVSPFEAEAERIERAHRLVIDDLGAEYLDPKGFFLAQLDALINERYAHKLPTVITTNVDKEPFKKRYEARIADRIREAGEFVKIGGPSLRKRP